VRIILEIAVESKNMVTVYNYNFVGLMNRSVTAPSNTNSKIIQGYSHDIHSLIVFVLIYMARDDRRRHLIAALRAATAPRQPPTAPA
jgi:hypothetical protein